MVAHFLPAVARAQWDRVLLMVRDIANPSGADEWFPKWRHKDWFVGSSWASGIVKREWGPDPHGRNQESISEAVNAYDALALYGNEMIAAFEQSNTDPSSSSAARRSMPSNQCPQAGTTAEELTVCGLQYQHRPRSPRGLESSRQPTITIS